MKRLNRIVGVLATAALLTVGIASAASLGIGTGQLSAGNAAVTGCTSSPLTATRKVNNSGDVTEVDVLSVPQACANQKLAVTLVENSGSASASTTVGACGSSSCTVAVTGFGTVLASNVNGYAFSLTQ